MFQFLGRWEGTPYMPGMRAQQQGVDCAQLVPAFLDFLYRTGANTPVPRMAQDTATHNLRAAWGTVKAVRQAFPSHVVTDHTIEPGDIILCRATQNISGPRRPGHAMIAMPRPFSALEAMPNTGVGLGTLEATRGILRVYRLEEKHRWA